MKRGSQARLTSLFLPASFLLSLAATPAKATHHLALSVQNQRISTDTFFFDVYIHTTNTSVYLSHSDFIFDYDEVNFSGAYFGMVFGSPILVNSYDLPIPYYDANINTFFGHDFNEGQLIITVVPPSFSNQSDFDTSIAVIDNTPGVHRLGTFYVTGIIDATINPDLQWVDDQSRGGNTSVYSLNAIFPWGTTEVPVTATDPTPTTEPSLAASTLQFSNVDTFSMTLSWTSGNGAKRIVLASESSLAGISPADGIIYSSDTVFGSGDQIGTTGTYIIYNGTDSTVNVSGLSQGTTYYFAVYEYNGGSGETENYINNGLTGDEGTLSTYITVNVKVFLQGPYGGGQMNATLNSKGYLPLSQPYNVSPWSYSGTESVASGFLASNTDIVDWVLVELRSGTAASTIVTRKACFVKRDGTLLDISGSGMPQITGVNSGSYYVVIRHRNHLATMTSSAIDLNANSSQYNFTSGISQFYGSDAASLGSGLYGMYTGDSNGSGDFSAIDQLRARLGVINGTTGYQSGDYNLSGDFSAIDQLRVRLAIINGYFSKVPK